MILGLASHFRKWCRQRRRTGSILPTPGLVEQNNFWLARQNEAARAADAAREVNGAVYGERLK